jgi:hypothetical protein
MKAMKICLFLIMVSLAGCDRTPLPPTPRNVFVVVNDSSGSSVAGAEVFQNGELKGSTDGTGNLAFPSEAPIGTQIFARRLVYTQPSYRAGTAGGWVMHVYQTSRVVNNDGSVTDQTIANPKLTQTLTLSPDNALIGWHLTASLDWDASESEFDVLKNRFNAASQYLYNLTDGQFFIEQVDMADDGQLWGSAEILFSADAWLWPQATYVGGFLGPMGLGAPVIKMAPFSENGDFVSMYPETIIHELGHLALGLADEYVGVNAFQENYCTAARHFGTGTSTDFNSKKPRAACAMDSPFESSKLCSAHTDSAHRGGNWQPSPCWNMIASVYRDPGLGVPRWIVRTPDMRGAVVGTLPPLPVGLRPKITPPMNRILHDLCTPFKFVDPAGASAAGGTVWVRPLFWGGDFTVGKLDSNSTLMVHGVHLGDTIWSPRSIVKVDSTMCTVTK